MTAQTGKRDVPLLSILCLTYNHAAFIATALESFLAQITSFEVEVVIGDDCSNDDTLQIVERLRERFRGEVVVLRSTVNQGITRNFRRTMKACRGQYIAICEGDDFWRGHGKLQMQVDFLEANPEYVLTFHDATIVDSAGLEGPSQLPARLRCDASKAELIATRPISTLTVCFRNMLGDLPTEFDHAPALDLCLWSLLGHHGQAKYLSEIEPAGYRVHSAGVFSMQSDHSRHIMTAQSLLCLVRVYARLGRHEVSEALLLKALQLGSMPLGFTARLRLLGYGLVRLIAPPFRGVQRLFDRASGATDRLAPPP